MITRKFVRYLIPAAVFLVLFLLSLAPPSGPLLLQIAELAFLTLYLIKAAKEYRAEIKADRQLQRPPSPDEP